MLLGCRAVVFVLLILGLARPRWPDERTRIPAQSAAIVIVLDVSGSMAEEDYQLDGRTASRLVAARDVLKRLLIGDGATLTGRSDDMVGLVTFAARPEDICPPTLSHTTVLSMLDAAQPVGTLPDSSTNIGDALALATDLVRRAPPRQKALILVSDGEHNVPDAVVSAALRPRQAAQLARALGVRVYTVFLPGVPGTEEARDVQKRAAAAMRDVADLAAGKAYEAGSIDDLIDLSRDIDAREKTRVESHQYLHYVEAYPWLGASAAAMLLLSVALEELRYRRIP
jgi:Ca-activated chloride channel family protein